MPPWTTIPKSSASPTAFPPTQHQQPPAPAPPSAPPPHPQPPPPPPPAGGYVSQYYRYPYYAQPCKCDAHSQIRYYNPRNKEFYYHTALKLTTAAPLDDGKDGGGGDNSTTSANNNSSERASARYYDPYGGYGGPYTQSAGYFTYNDSGVCELVLVCLALILWLYSFYRLWLVWQNTLNFNESSIQGPQGWDLLVSWVVERIRLRKLALKVPGMSMRRRCAGGAAAPVRRGAAVAISEEDEDDIELAERSGSSGGENGSMDAQKDGAVATAAVVIPAVDSISNDEDSHRLASR